MLEWFKNLLSSYSECKEISDQCKKRNDIQVSNDEDEDVNKSITVPVFWKSF